MTEKNKKTALQKVEGGKNAQEKKPTSNAQAQPTGKTPTVAEL